MTHDADMGPGGLDRTMPVVGAKIAAVPGAAEQRRELAGFAAEYMEDGGELFRKQEESAIGDGLLIAQSMEDAVGCGARGGDAARGPTRVGLGEEAGDLAPASSFAGLARFADQDDEEIEAVTGGAHEAVGRGADEVAEGGQELQEDGSGIGFGVRRKATDGETGKTVEGVVGQCGWWGRRGSGWQGERRLGILVGIGFLGVVAFLLFFGKTGLFFKVRLFLGEGLVGRRGCLRRLPVLHGKQLSAAALYGGERGQGEGSVEGVMSECHNTTLSRFRFVW
jgi:hypothetical protein